MMVKTSILLVSDQKAAQEVFTVPAARRLVLDIKRLGVRNIHVVGLVDRLVPILSDLIPPGSFHSTSEPSSLPSIVEKMGLDGEQILVAKASCVTNRHSLSMLFEKGESAPICRMKAQGESSCDGLYLTYRPTLAPVLCALWSSADPAAEICNEVHHIEDPDALPHMIRNGAEDAKASEAKLLAALAAHSSPDDGFIARNFDRRISRFISSRLAHTRITPNQVTLTGMTLGFVAASLLALGGYWLQLIGSLLFVFCVIIDGVDGEIARLKLQESEFGHYLDVITDNIVHVAIFVGIAVGLYRDTGSIGYIRALWFMLGGFALCALAVYQCILRLSPNELEMSPRLIKLMALVSNRDFAYLVAVLALFDLLKWFLIGAAGGTYIFAFGLWALSYYERNKRSSFAADSPFGRGDAAGRKP